MVVDRPATNWSTEESTRSARHDDETSASSQAHTPQTPIGYQSSLPGRLIDALLLSLPLVQSLVLLRSLTQGGTWLATSATMLALALLAAVLIPLPQNRRRRYALVFAGTVLLTVASLGLTALSASNGAAGPAPRPYDIARRICLGASELYHGWPPLEIDSNINVTLTLIGTLAAPLLWLICLPRSTRPFTCVPPLACLALREATCGPAPSWLELVAVVAAAFILLDRAVSLPRHSSSEENRAALAHDSRTAIAAVASFALALALAPPIQQALWSSGVGLGSQLFAPSVNPVVDLSQALQRGGDDAQLVYTSSSNEELYLRLVTISNLGNSTWEFDAPADDGPALPGSHDTDTPAGLPDAKAPTGRQTSAAISTRSLRSRFVPVFPGANTSSAARTSPIGQWHWSSADTIWSNDSTTMSLDYTLEGPYVEPITKPEQIGALKTLRDKLNPSGSHASRGQSSACLELPSDLPDSLREASEEVLGLVLSPASTTASSGQDEVETLRWLLNYFSHGFVYTLDAPMGPDNLSSIDAFLRERRGYCTHFAATAALMARELGIPSRIVIGYRPTGLRDPSGAFVVPASSLHAWTELYLKDLGWIGVDVTPASSASGAARAVRTTSTSKQSGLTPETRSTEQVVSPAAPSSSSPSTSDASSKAILPQQGKTSMPSWTMSLLLDALVLALLGLPRLTRHLQTKRRFAEVAAGTKPFAAVWDELLDQAMDAGIGPWRHLTEQQIVDDIVAKRDLPPRLVEELRRLVRKHCLAAYGSHNESTISDDTQAELARLLHDFDAMTQPRNLAWRAIRLLLPRSVVMRCVSHIAPSVWHV